MITFLKLGGSVITEKSRRRTARPETIHRIASEIARALERDLSMQLLLGHGSGSFGHAVAAEHGTHLGADSRQDWHGFASVWSAARELNSLIIAALEAEGLPAIAFAPSATAISEDGQLITMSYEPIQRALSSGLLPVVYGDVVFDRAIGASIVSTEAVFGLLAAHLEPDRLLLAGRTAGVYEAASTPSDPLPVITPSIRSALQFSSPEGEDVTGGMEGKVDFCLSIAQAHPDMEILIFSAEQDGQLLQVLSGEAIGTRIQA